MQQLIGQSLARYRIVSLLGEGGMGAVFKGHDPTLQRDVAIKVMHPHFAGQPNFQERFLQEARTAARLRHPGIVQVYDFGQAQGLLYIVMEYIPGENLREMLQQLWSSSEWILLPEALQLVRQVCLALDYAHRQGVLHRDIKPDNVMLRDEQVEDLPYRPVLTDLGLAKLVEGGLVTQEGTSMGTPAYMSPEQAIGEVTDARSDVYSLGILLYELAVGRLPFPIKTLSQAIRYHTKEPPPPPRSLRPELPDIVDKAILKALRKQPADRFADAAALAEALAYVRPKVAANTAPPTAPAGAVSLMTRLEVSRVEQRGPSILAAFPQTPSRLSQDRVVILAPDQTTRTIQLESDRFTIGRSKDNDLALDEPDVSRHHARVEFDGQRYTVTDLNSSNGTYLANVKLLPGMAEAWTPGKVLRIGQHYLRLERSQPAAGRPMVTRADGTVVEASLIHASPGAGDIAIFMEPGELAVEAGGSISAPLTILNQGQVVDHFQVSVAGAPAEWISVSPPSIHLMPAQQHEVTLSVQPPHSPASRAQPYPLIVRVASQKNPQQAAELSKTLTVTPYYQFQSEVSPQRIRVGQRAVVSVQNQGNASNTYTFTWRDRANELAFEPLQAQLQVGPGETKTAEFKARPQVRRWFGGLKVHPIAVQVAPAEGQAQPHGGEVVSKGLIPAWLPPLLLFLCLILAGAAAFGYNLMLSQQRQATAVAQGAAATLTAQALALDTDGDGLSDVEEARLGTDPTLADTDQDGLSDKAEVDGATNPLQQDTDGDGLSDGDEVRWKTDPKVIDTDGDTLPDGREVFELNTSPTNADTDGDGLNDQVDPDPGQLPTPTPIPSPTPTGTATPIPTATPDVGATAQAIAATTAEAQATLDAAAAAQALAAAQTATAQANATAQAATAEAMATIQAAADATATAGAVQTAEAEQLAALQRKWQLQNFETVSTGTKETPPADLRKMTAEFTEDGKFLAVGTVNSLSGSYQVGSGQTLEVGQLITTLMAGPGLEWEIKFSKALGSATTYQVQGNQLKVFYNDGLEVMNFIIPKPPITIDPNFKLTPILPPKFPILPISTPTP